KFYKNSAFTKIFTCCVIFALIPVLNSSFYAFNDNYYARWFYMPLLILAVMNMHSFTLCRKMINYGLKVTAFFTCIFCIFALTPTTGKDGGFKLGLQKETAVFWLYLMISLISLYLVFAVVQNCRSKPKYAQKLLCAALSMVCLYGTVHMALVKLPQLDNDANYIKQNYTVLDTFSLDDEQTNYRLDAYQSYNNLGLFLNKPVLQFFNSTVTPSIMEFYPYVGTTRTVSSKPGHENYALRSLLSVKYLLLPTHEFEHLQKDEYDLIYSEHSVIKPYKVMKNNYFVPMGFTYDYYVTADQLNSVEKENRANIMLRAMLIDENIVDIYKAPMAKLSDDALTDTGFAIFEQDVFERQLSAGYYFEQSDSGFVSNIYLDEANFVFYSVPYDDGFTAFVNGTEVEIVKVNSGLCAVFAPQGDCEIVFRYETPHLKTGIFLNLLGLGTYIIYLVLIFKKKVKI
ncbi:MAG: YfhO family protein, partial [Oscillospiraceae bacterium]|nr:YfhO family protein [Oscillospiraceae bacterium]